MEDDSEPAARPPEPSTPARYTAIRTAARSALEHYQVNLQTVNFNTLVSRFTVKGADGPFDALLLGLSGGGNLYPLGVNILMCDGNLHVYNLSGACLTDWGRELQRLYLAGDRELDRAKRIAIGRQIQNLEAQHQPSLYLATLRASVAWRARVRGELPAGIADADVGPRVLELTHREGQGQGSVPDNLSVSLRQALQSMVSCSCQASDERIIPCPVVDSVPVT